jgi:very-short-patch-repair endonuclease
MGGQAAGNRFKDWVADFVVCRPDFTIVAVVELAGSATSRDAERTRERKDESLRAAGIKVVRLPGGDALADIPNESGLKALVAALPVNSSTAQLLRRAS